MEVSARLRNARLSPQKCRLVAHKARGLPVADALNVLRFLPQKSAGVLLNLLQSALANAEHNAGADIDLLHVQRIVVNEGSYFKRFRPRAKGRASPILKRTSHIEIVLSDEKHMAGRSL